MSSLSVFVDNVLLGTLHDTDPLSFTYAQDCLSGLMHAPFSALIPPLPGQISTTAVTSFFENLLPEGDERALLQAKHHVTTVFGMLSKVGGDTAGSVVVLPEGQRPQPDDYLPVTWEQIGTLVNNASEAAPALTAAADSNVSLSGAQHKLLLSVDPGGNPALPLNASISTHILKPDIKRAGLKVFGSAINETLIMNLAQACKLPAAHAEYLPSVSACLISRYDRITSDDGSPKRLYQADFCQLLDKPSGVKYEGDGGPSFRDCYNLLKNRSAVPLTDCHNLVRWLFFNLMVGNNDTHAKNLSMLNINGKARLAPFYDLMCTQVYAGLSNKFAFKIGQYFEPGNIGYQELAELSDSIGVNRRLMVTIAMDIAEQIENELPGRVEALLPLTAAGSSEKVLLSRVSMKIDSNLKKIRARLQA